MPEPTITLEEVEKLEALEKAGRIERASGLSDGSATAEFLLACMEHFPRLLSTLREQQALIAKLPSTSDGVPIVPGMQVFLADQMQDAKVEAVSDDPSWPASATQKDGAVRSPFRAYWFSTRDAAAQAAANPEQQRER